MRPVHRAGDGPERKAKGSFILLDGESFKLKVQAFEGESLPLYDDP
jgi:hypothetical protein